MAKRTASGIKQARKDARRRLRNRIRRLALKRAVKAVRTAQTREEALKAFVAAQSVIDRSAKTRLIHPNAASRLKSRLMRAISYLK
ncbi:MAG: 30S ribosomal protein S20 [candidate division WOR-3 bacterium]